MKFDINLIFNNKNNLEDIIFSIIVSEYLKEYEI